MCFQLMLFQNYFFNCDFDIGNKLFNNHLDGEEVFLYLQAMGIIV
jgi:hypothetical protein